MRRSVGTFLRQAEGGAVVGLALVIRAAVLLLTPNALQADPDGYRAVAENLLQHGVLGHGPQPTAKRPPLYPLILAGCAVFGSAARGVLSLLHLAMGGATVWLAWHLARTCRLRRRQRWLVAALMAADPLLLRASTLVMTETVAVLLATAALNLWTHYLRQPTGWRAGLAGLLMGLAVLCRPAWSLCLLALGAMVLSSPVRQKRLLRPLSEKPGPLFGKGSLLCHPRLRLFALYGLGAGLVWTPWAWRNALQFGWPVLTTTHGGYTMFLANNPWLYEHLRQGGSLQNWNPKPFHQTWDQTVQDRFLLNPSGIRKRNVFRQSSLLLDKGSGGRVSRWNWERNPLSNPSSEAGVPPTGDSPFRWIDELAADRWAYQQAWHAIREEPGLFCRAVLLRWSRFWQLTPSQKGEAGVNWLVYYGSGAWYAGEFILAIWGIWVVYTKSNRNFALQNTLLVGLIWSGLLSGVHIFYWTEMRMRCPLTAAIALAAASGIFQRPLHRRQTAPSPR